MICMRLSTPLKTPPSTLSAVTSRRQKLLVHTLLLFLHLYEELQYLSPMNTSMHIMTNTKTSI